jgi:hypothetical protein
MSVFFYAQMLNYAVIGVCFFLLWRFVRRNFKGPNEEKRRILNRQMNRNLLIQVPSEIENFTKNSNVFGIQTFILSGYNDNSEPNYLGPAPRAVRLHALDDDLHIGLRPREHFP